MHSNYYNENDDILTCDICRATGPWDAFKLKICSNCWEEIHAARKEMADYRENKLPDIEKVVSQMKNGGITVNEFRLKMAELLDL